MCVIIVHSASSQQSMPNFAFSWQGPRLVSILHGFSTPDFQNGHWQLHSRRMPVGLTGAPSSFQREMEKLFQGFTFVTTYFNNILIHSSDDKAHTTSSPSLYTSEECEIDINRMQVLCTLSGHCLILVTFLLVVYGVSLDPNKVTAVQE